MNQPSSLNYSEFPSSVARKLYPIAVCIMNNLVNGVQATTVIYMDDLLLTCRDVSVIKQTITHIAAQLKITLTTIEEHVHSYLCMKWGFSEKCTRKISMTLHTLEA